MFIKILFDDQSESVEGLAKIFAINLLRPRSVKNGGRKSGNNRNYIYKCGYFT